MRFCLASILAAANATGCASGGGQRQVSSLADAHMALLASLVRSAGERIRIEHPSGFGIYPKFLTSSQHEVFTPNDSNQSVLVESFRAGAGAQYVDTVAVRDSALTALLPDSARYFYTLAGTPTVKRDSGTVEVFESVFVKLDTDVFQATIFRYMFVKDSAGTWRFRRRILRYGA